MGSDEGQVMEIAGRLKEVLETNDLYYKHRKDDATAENPPTKRGILESTKLISLLHQVIGLAMKSSIHQNALGDCGVIETILQLADYSNLRGVMNGWDGEIPLHTQDEADGKEKSEQIPNEVERGIVDDTDDAEVLVLLLWSLVKLCRRSLDKSTASHANILRCSAPLPTSSTPPDNDNDNEGDDATKTGDESDDKSESPKGCERVVDIMGKYGDREAICLPCCWLLMIMASDSPERQRRLAELNATKAVVYALHVHTHSLAVCEMASRVARNLAADDDVAAHCVEVGICEALVHTLKTTTSMTNSNPYPRSPALQLSQSFSLPSNCVSVVEAVMWAFVNLSCDPQIAMLLGAAGACDAVIAAAELPVVMENLNCSLAICSTLRNLACVYNYSIFASTRVCEYLINLLSLYYPDEGNQAIGEEKLELLETALWSLSNLSCDATLGNRFLSSVSEVSNPGANPINRVIRFFIDSHPFPPNVALDSTLSPHTVSPERTVELIECAFSALRNLAACSATNQTLLINNGSVQVVSKCLASYLSDDNFGGQNMAGGDANGLILLRERLVECSVGTLVNLICGSEEGKSEARKNQCIEMACRVLDAYGKSLGACELSLKLICVCTNKCPANATIAAQSKALPLAIEALSTHYSDEEILRLSCEVLFSVHFAGEGEEKERLREGLKAKNQLDETGTRANPKGTLEEIRSAWGVEDILALASSR